MEIKTIIVQAGGRGSRLETLTLNKPKCLVPVDNLPMLFHLFKRFPGSRFIIIADYKSDVLEKYLGSFAGVEYKVIRTNEKGTCSGINDALAEINQSEAFILTWCDLIIADELTIPSDLNSNFVGISGSFECRWSYENDAFVKKPSTDNGVSGFFIFKNKSELKSLQRSGEFVAWLSQQEIHFERFSIKGSREIGTVLSYYQTEINKPNCRPFNQVTFLGDRVKKIPLDEQGFKLAALEESWYKKVIALGFSHIPQIHEFTPLIMKKIEGKNIYEYNALTHTQKKIILQKIIEGIKKLHGMVAPIDGSREDCEDNYIGKTFDRLEKVRHLVPFANQEFISINGITCRNVFFFKAELEQILRDIFPSEFSLIHGDPTFSNILLETESVEPFFIDPRGYFGQTQFYGDKNYDWAKLYYSIVGNYDQFNLKNFALEISETDVNLSIVSSNWEDVESTFFEETKASPKTIKLLHSIIWLSLTTYAWEDYDSICGAFYNGLLNLHRAMND
jgi:GTP:adenosylcobinamide-phosphate guanylyltransferase/thiamine kinase-like enzyme